MSAHKVNEVLDTEPTHHAEHMVSPKIYALIFGALLLGTGLTVAASYIEMGDFNAVVALGIACTKAVLVILFFMHVKYSSRLTKLTVAAGFFTFIVLITMSLTDYISRAWGLW
ncbi:cytochrome C oxidase subunit IV family protein [Alloacidobacterium dinghuense]|uniref:Cytochrome C oxidase subunit IV family protein n=1 Tax=Alloacidobacterium dinghuense TaxID=2763107 RepID=A0A7G8BFY4_9BACT|nr:cytochrome C oxidase subunit IV family protein [Alloacidobacterium dinghuense]QNI31454.1 cytochrome C oxidase subunit IV family protein [Alloacidobacterium dinghuense]